MFPILLSARRVSGADNTDRCIRSSGMDSGGSRTNVIEYITISSAGNSTDFGNATVANEGSDGLSNGPRGVIKVGSGGSTGKEIDYVTMATAANAADFGDTLSSTRHGGGVADATRGLIYLGDWAAAAYETIEYLTIATLGNTTDFGDATVGRNDAGQAGGSDTRGMFAGGRQPAGGSVNTTDYVTIASVGNATDFGDLATAVRNGGVACSNVRYVMCSGYGPVPAGGEAAVDIIQYFTIASVGNAADFGDITTASSNTKSGGANGVRGITQMGGNTGSRVDTIEYITIASTGNATDFGNTLLVTDRGGAMSWHLAEVA